MTPVPAGDQTRELVDRVRALLSGRQVREVRMFGVVAVMVDGAMAVAVHNDGSLLVRVDPAEDGRLLTSPDASRAEMGAGRSMGEGWIRVEARALHRDTALSTWLEAATGYLARRRSARPTPQASNQSRKPTDGLPGHRVPYGDGPATDRRRRPRDRGPAGDGVG